MYLDDAGNYSTPPSGGGGGAVDSVNGQIGTVVLTTDNVPEGTGNKYTNAADKARLANTSGTNTGDQDISGIAQNTAAIATNTAQIATNKADIAQNVTDIAANKAKSDANEADIASNDAEIAAIQAEQATQNTAIGAATSAISAIQSDQTTQDAQIAANATKITAIESEQTTQDAAIAANTAKSTTNETDIASNEAAINAIGGQVAQNTADIADKADVDGAALVNATINGVTPVSGGDATKFLNEAGAYVAPPASGGNLKSDGTVPMDATYVPTVDKGIATKEYVDNNSGGGVPKTFENGLTEANDIVKLGGLLTADTIINLVTYFLELQSPGGGPNQAKFSITGGIDGTISSQVNDQIATVINRVTLNGGASSQSSVISGSLISRLTVDAQGISMESQTLNFQDVKLYMDDEDILKLDVRPAAGEQSIFTIREAPAGNAAFQIKYTFDRDGVPKIDTDIATKKYVDDTAGDVNGPSGSFDNNIAAFDGATGKLLKDSGKSIADIEALEDKTAGFTRDDANDRTIFDDEVRLANPLSATPDDLDLATVKYVKDTSANSPITLDVNSQSYEAAATTDGQELQLGRDIFVLAKNIDTTSARKINPKLFIVGKTSLVPGEEKFKEAQLAEASDLQVGALYGLNCVEADAGTKFKIQTYGEITGLDTSTYPPNAILYADTIRGEITTTKPTIDVFPIGVVKKQHPTNGIIFVNTIYAHREDTDFTQVGQQREFLTGDPVTIAGAQFYNVALNGAGTVPTAIQSVTVGDDTKDFYNILYATDASVGAISILPGRISGQLEFQTDIQAGEEKLYVEVYKMDSAGNIVDSGNGLPNGRLGVAPIVYMESPVYQTAPGSIGLAAIEGVVPQGIMISATEHVVYLVGAEKVGTAAGDKVISIFSGTSHQSYINVTAPLKAQDVSYRNVTSGLAATDVQQALDELASQIPTGVGSQPVGTIIQSILTESQFNSITAGEWVICDGRSISGTPLSTVTGLTSAPDLRGAYLRMAGQNASKSTWNGGSLRNFQDNTTKRPNSNLQVLQMFLEHTITHYVQL